MLPYLLPWDVGWPYPFPTEPPSRPPLLPPGEHVVDPDRSSVRFSTGLGPWRRDRGTGPVTGRLRLGPAPDDAAVDLRVVVTGPGTGGPVEVRFVGTGRVVVDGRWQLPAMVDVPVAADVPAAAEVPVAAETPVAAAVPAAPAPVLLDLELTGRDADGALGLVARGSVRRWPVRWGARRLRVELALTLHRTGRDHRIGTISRTARGCGSRDGDQPGVAAAAPAS